MSAHQLFSAETYSGGYDRGDGSTIDGLGDVAVKRLSEMVLNDQPMQDPRWGDARGTMRGEELHCPLYSKPPAR